MGNGQCERLNRTLLGMLGCLGEDKKKSWKDHLATITHAYNCTRNKSTGCTPYELMFGRTPKLPIDIQLQPHTREAESTYSEFVQNLKKQLQYAWDLAKEHQKRASEKQKKYYDLHQRGAVLNIGDVVLVKKVGFQGPHKLANRWENEPYIVKAQPNADIPVYTVVPKHGKRRSRTLQYAVTIGNHHYNIW